jgi:hypothetical protein
VHVNHARVLLQGIALDFGLGDHVAVTSSGGAQIHEMFSERLGLRGGKKRSGNNVAMLIEGGFIRLELLRCKHILLEQKAGGLGMNGAIKDL